jgi:hypothetical protein
MLRVNGKMFIVLKSAGVSAAGVRNFTHTAKEGRLHALLQEGAFALSDCLHMGARSPVQQLRCLSQTTSSSHHRPKAL